MQDAQMNVGRRNSGMQGQRIAGIRKLTRMQVECQNKNAGCGIDADPKSAGFLASRFGVQDSMLK
jgi:hypothetical protein